MKLKHITSAIGLLFLGIFLMSNSAGRANGENAASTQAPGESSQTCSSSSCHGTNAYDPVLTFTIIDEDGNSATSYNLDQRYTVSINITANIGTPIGHGFQMVTLDSDDNNYNAWGNNLAPGTQLVELDNQRVYWEHRALLPASTFDIDWTAPSSNLGPITFYGAAIAANGNGNRTGDGGTTSTFTLEGPTISNLATGEPNLNVAVQHETLTNGYLSYNSSGDIDRLLIFNTQGEIVHTIEEPQNLVDLTMLQVGIYFLHFQGEASHYSSKIVIQ